MKETIVLICLILLGAPLGSQTLVGGSSPSGIIQFDETNGRKLFTCSQSGKDCRLAEGVKLEDVVEYFYLQQRREERRYYDLYKLYSATLDNERKFVDRLEKILNGKQAKPKFTCKDGYWNPELKGCQNVPYCPREGCAPIPASKP